MSGGLNIVICIIAVVLVIIAERGIPVKLSKWDTVLYVILFCVFTFISNNI